MLVQQLPILHLNLMDFRDMSVFALSDLSTYLTIPDANHLALQITVPGGNTINVPFTPLNVNVYKCVDLGLTCSDSGCTPLPDGIYNIKYSVIPDNTSTIAFPNTSVEYNFIKIDHIKCKYEHTFNKLNLICDCCNDKQKRYKQELRQIKLYIDGSVSECNIGNYVLSNNLYNKANYLLNNMSCNSNNNFKNDCKC